MPVKADLYLLIDSMSRAEKRYFHIYATAHTGKKDSNYVRLFDIINNQKEFDEDEIVGKFSDFAKARNFSQTKNKLTQLILKSLEQFHSEKGDKEQIHHLLNQATILENKNLHKMAFSLLKKAEKIAEDNEFASYMLEILRRKNVLMHTMASVSQIKKSIAALEDKEDEWIKKYNLMICYLRKNNEFFRIVQEEGEVTEGPGFERYKEVIDSPLFKDESLPDTFMSKKIFYNLNQVWCQILHQYEDAYLYSKKLLELHEENPNYVNQNPKGYIFLLNNILNACKTTNKEKEFYIYLKKLKDLRNDPLYQTPDFLGKIMARCLLHEIDMKLKSGALEEAVKVWEDAEAEWEMRADTIIDQYQILIPFLVIKLKFLTNNFSGALYWTNRILNLSPKTVRKDIQAMARIINLLIHFELGNNDLLMYQIRSTERYFDSADRKLNEFDKVLLKFAKKLNRSASPSRQKTAFKNILEKMESLKKDDRYKNLIEYFPVIPWLQSKLESKTLPEVLDQVN